MINISLEEDNLKISSDSNKILAPIIKNWLIKNRFTVKTEEKTYTFSGKVNEQFLEKIHKLLEDTKLIKIILPYFQNYRKVL